MGTDSFSYDDRSRLTSSTVSLQGLGYGYDRFGNLNPSLVNPANNRLSAGTYDAGGNLTEYAGQRYDYDGLSRQVAYNGGFERYLYDGAGERIARLTSPNPGADFYTVTPCRLLDTRTSPPSLSSTVLRVVQITGSCGVPADATGVSGNLTVTNVSEQGFLRLFPTGTNPFVNGVSYRPGVTRANNFNLGLSGLGRLTLTASTASTADGIVDVSGYYAYPAPTWTLTFRDEANRLSTEYAVTSSTITRAKNYFHFGNLLVSTRDSGGTHLYYASDHLGTPRLVTDQGGAAVENHTYHPFGQEITPLFGNQPLKFAAMERDQASGNDSAHARVCSPTRGRFLSPDTVQGKIFDPQSWNRYAYAHNNPLNTVDRNGLWPTKIHNEIINRAFPGLSPQQRQILMRASSRMDNPAFGGQDPGRSYQHAMKGPRETVEQASQKATEFYQKNINEAKTLQQESGSQNLDPKALQAVGRALHTVSDASSPAHSGFQTWSPVGRLLEGTIVHPAGESTINANEMNMAVQMERAAFAEAFGTEALKKAIEPPPAPSDTCQQDPKNCDKTHN